MISLILHAKRLLMLSNLCSRSQQLKMKKVFLNDGGKLMVNHFTKNRVTEILGHTFSWPKPSSNCFSTKGSITTIKPRRAKTSIFLFFVEKKRYLWAENKLVPFFWHSSNAVLKLVYPDHWAFETTVWRVMMSCLLHLRCQYRCPSSRRRATSPTRKILGRSSPVLRLRGVLTS